MNVDELCINTIRMLSADCVQRANSGHPGLPMGAAPMAYILWTRFLRHNPSNPDWPDRDRFVLSAGHGSMLLYSLLHLTGYDLALDELRNFRQWRSLTPGHPESHLTPGVETTTGPLGQGFANGVGMAIAERYLASYFNRPGHQMVNHQTYGIISDGELMEGVTHEAASLAGHLKLGKLVYLYDDNHITIEGSTEIAFTENPMARFEAYGWHVQRVEDGNDLKAIEDALTLAGEEKTRPSIIAVRTIIGFGSPNKQGTAGVHGEPLGEDELRLTKENLGWPLEPECHIPDEALSYFRKALDSGKAWEAEWQNGFKAYEKAYPEQASEWFRWVNGDLPRGWDEDIPVFPADEKNIATRASSGTVLNAIARNVPNLIGGSADLAPSNKTFLKDADFFQEDQYGGRNFHFGVREHGMGSILNGMALHGGIIPYGGTFLVFSDYMRPAIRLAALMGLHLIYVFTHDSIGVGEDGPTHQPIEHLASLRAMPRLTVIRPCDANETSEAWRFAMQNKGPVALALTRQGLPTLDRNRYAPAAELQRGAYILKEGKGGNPDAVLVASGSEVCIALDAAAKIEEKGLSVRVVSMPSWELFDDQPADYRQEVVPKDLKAYVAVEAGASQGWHYYLGNRAAVVGIDHFGASAPAKTLYEEFGFTAERVVEETMKLLEQS
jgi:transketolase